MLGRMGNIEGKEDTVKAYLEDRIDFDELVETIGAKNAETVRSSKDMLKESDEIAEELAGIENENSTEPVD